MELDAYPDVRDALSDLREKRIHTAVFTNGVLASARHALRFAGINDLIDDVLSIEPARIFKPSPDAYRLVIEHYATEARNVTFVSSNGWDVSGASAFGFRVLWCNRANITAERFNPPPAPVLTNLRDIATVVAGSR